ncbi:hypothetical protein ACJJTC_008586 [Scirpophaga incertulas]
MGALLSPTAPRHRSTHSHWPLSSASTRCHVSTQQRARASRLKDRHIPFIISSGSVTIVYLMEKLIEAVRAEQCLYDVKHPDYLNTKLKCTIWKQIAETLNLKDGNEAKKSWEKLRNNHRDALRRQKMLKRKSDSSTVAIKSWRFQEKMAFLIPYMAKRTSATNINEEIPSDPGSSSVIRNGMKDIVTDNQESREEEFSQIPESQSTGTSDHVNKIKTHKKNTKKDLLHKSFNVHERRAATGQQEWKRLIAKAKNNDFTISNVKNDPLFHFFISMYETTKRLPL